MLNKLKQHWPVLVILISILVGFYPSLFLGKVPFNGNNLVSFFSPWVYEKWSGYPAGVPSIPEIPDQSRIYYPYMHLTRESYRLGQIPLWNPYNFAGNPHMAEWQSGVFYPLHVLLLILSLPVYWTLFQITGLFLAGLFTYFYLRNLKLAQLASVFGALSFSFSTFMFSWNAEVITAPHSILWLPLMLLLIDKFLAKPKTKYWLLLILSGVLSVLAGYWQTTLYLLGVSGIYMLVRYYFILPHGLRWRPKTRYLFSLLAILPLVAGLTAFHLLPTWELYNRSSRPILSTSARLLENHKTFLLKPHRLITFLAPDFFGHPATRNQFSYSNRFYYEWALFIGTIPLLILPFIILSKRKKLKRISLFFLILAVITGSFAFDLPHSRAVFDYKIPVLSTSITNRILFIPAFLLSVLTAIGLQSWLSAKSSERRRITLKSLVFWLVVFSGIWLFLWKVAPELPYNQRLFPANWFTISRRNTVIPTLVFLAGALLLAAGSLKKRLLSLSVLLLIAGSTTQNLYQLFKFTPFSEARFVYPDHQTIKFLQDHAGINRYLGYNGLFLSYNFATKFGIYTVEGYDSLNDRRRSQLLFAAQNQGKLTQDLPTPVDAVISRSLDNPQVLRMMQLTGVKYLVDHSEFPDALAKNSQPTLPSEKQKLVFEDGDWKIYEYTDALPRAFLAGEHIVETNDQKTVDLIFSPDINLRNTIILRQKPLAVTPEPDVDAAVQVASYTPNKIRFTTQSTKDQLLFLSDTYYPGWKAKIDGVRTEVLAANFAFRAVPVPSGNHTIEMYYLPESFTTGLLIAGGTLIVIYLVTKKL